MKRLMVEAMGEAWRRPGAWAAGLGLLAGWCAVAWWWLGRGGERGEVALVALGAVVLLGGPGWLCGGCGGDCGRGVDGAAGALLAG